ncbi:lipase [Gordonia sp. UCD-TK1]|nr:lipase [Gordonia sp. UCD-TK1]
MSPPPVLIADVRRARGQIVGTDTVPDAWFAALPPGITAQRLVYRSASGLDGKSTIVSGALFVPASSPPPHGHPLISYAHGTTGITRDCGPSDQDMMFGDLTAVADFLAAGYAVVTTDYQGLGVRPGQQAPHPYLEPRTAAYNVIDAARAAQSTDLGVGGRWFAVGRSQGGGAAWSTAEEFAQYGDGAGELVGAVAVAPLLDAGYFVTRAQEGSLSRAQRFLYPLVVHGVAQARPGVNPGDHLAGLGTEAVPVCSAGRTALAGLSVPDDAALNAVTPGAAQTLSHALENYALPRLATNVPIAAFYGGTDPLIPVDVMEDTLTRACELGDQLMRVRHDQQGHGVDPGPAMATWMRDRLAGVPAPTDC